MDGDPSAIIFSDAETAELILANAPIAVFVTDLNGRMHYANQCFEASYGFCANDWSDKMALELWPPSQAEQLVALELQVRATTAVARGEAELRDANGESRRTLITKFPVHDASGRLSGIGTILSDSIEGRARSKSAASDTDYRDDVEPGEPNANDAHLVRIEDDLHRMTGERDAAEEALSEKGRHLQLIADHLPVLIVHYDAQLRYQFVNDTYRRWRCQEHAPIIGKTVLEVVGVELYSNTEPALSRALAGEQLWFEYTTTFPDGKTRDIHGLLIPEFDRYSAVIGVFALGNDVTELKQMERKLLRRERLATIGQVAGTVAHELRTPLATIIASASVLRRFDDGVQSRTTQVLDRIERAVGRCTTVIESLLDYMRVPALNRQTIDLDSWLVSEIGTWSIPDSVTLQHELHAGVSVKVNRERLAQAVENLRDNALAAMRSEAQLPPSGSLTLKSRVHGGRIEIRLADSGSGIPVEAHDEVFEPLVSLRTVGVGLGLPLVRRIMEEHGGGAAIELSAPTGTVMILWLPLTTALSVQEI